jgi:hypothetical protein
MSDTTQDSSQQGEQSLGALFATASRDLSALVHSEIELAKTEIRVDIKNGVAGGAMFAATGLLGLLALILLLISAAFGLVAAGLDPAVAFLVVAGALLVIAAVLAFVGKRTVSKVGAPERTIRTTKDFATYLKRRRSGDAQSPSS